MQWRTDALPAGFANGYADWMARCYYDYLRVLVPSGSTLDGATTQPVPAEWMDNGQGDAGLVEAGDGDAGTTTFSTFLVVPHGESRAVGMTYRPPAGVLTRDDQGWHYRLKLQKQAGTGALPYSVRLRLPPNAQVVSASPAPAASANGELTFAGRLDVDQVVNVTFRSS